MSKLSKPERLTLQQKRDQEAQLKDIQNHQFKLFLNGPSYVDLASALTPRKQFHYEDDGEIHAHLHLFAEMLDRLIAERES